MDPAIKRLAISLWGAMDCTVGRSLIEAANAGEWLTIAKSSVDPRAYSDPEVFRRDYQCVEYLRKYPGLPIKVDRVAAAKQVWREAESQCYWTNERLSPFLHGASQDDGLIALIKAVKKEVRYLLGPWTVPHEGRFGPGSTFNDKGHYTLLPDKLANCPTRTPNNTTHMLAHLGTVWCDLTVEKFGRLFDTVPGDRFTTASKNALTDRGITIPPSLNVYWQLAYGTLMKQRLKNRGLDLATGQRLHERKAREASLTGRQATVDLKTASDTVAKVLVQLTLPEDWFLALSELRATKTLVDGKWIFLEKFSSMGNGYTFELETTIFAAISGAVIRLMGGCPEYGQNIAVYGDDIIVDTPYVHNVLAALRFFGFTPNDRKTFVDGPFRESCGGDFFLGHDVSVTRITSEVEDPADWITVTNGLRRTWFNKDKNQWNHHVDKTWRKAQDNIPREIRQLCRGPERLGDLLIHDIESAWKPKYNVGHEVLGVPTSTRGMKNGQLQKIVLVEKPPSDTRWVRTWRPITRAIKWGHWIPDVELASRIYSCISQETGYTGRDAVAGYKYGWASVT